MQDRNLSRRYLVDQSPLEVFNAINEVSTWWSQDFVGESKKPGDEFEVRFGDVHYSRHQVAEMLPGKKVVWLVPDSYLSFLENKTEWTGTQIIFEISENDGRSELLFTHVGLVPESECFKDCSNGWNQYLQHSLIPYITTGTANPNVLQKEIDEKAV